MLLTILFLVILFLTSLSCAPFIIRIKNISNYSESKRKNIKNILEKGHTAILHISTRLKWLKKTKDIYQKCFNLKMSKVVAQHGMRLLCRHKTTGIYNNGKLFDRRKMILTHN